jgi:hypothetical protein
MMPFVKESQLLNFTDINFESEIFVLNRLLMFKHQTDNFVPFVNQHIDLISSKLTTNIMVTSIMSKFYCLANQDNMVSKLINHLINQHPKDPTTVKTIKNTIIHYALEGKLNLAKAYSNKYSELVSKHHNNRPLSKLAATDKVQGVYGAEDHSVLKVREDLSTGTTQQFTDGVEFGKRSNVFSEDAALYQNFIDLLMKMASGRAQDSKYKDHDTIETSTAAVEWDITNLEKTTTEDQVKSDTETDIPDNYISEDYSEKNDQNNIGKIIHQFFQTEKIRQKAEHTGGIDVSEHIYASWDIEGKPINFSNAIKIHNKPNFYAAIDASINLSADQKMRFDSALSNGFAESSVGENGIKLLQKKIFELKIHGDERLYTNEVFINDFGQYLIFFSKLANHKDIKTKLSQQKHDLITTKVDHITIPIEKTYQDISYDSSYLEDMISSFVEKTYQPEDVPLSTLGSDEHEI